MLDSLRLTLQLRRERKRNALATARIEEEQKKRHAFMMELSAAGYQVVKIPTL
jgi:hypothetical protein